MSGTEDSTLSLDEPGVDSAADGSGRKKKGVFGKIKGMFGGSKRRTRSSDGGKLQRKEKSESKTSDRLAEQAQNVSNLAFRISTLGVSNQISVSADNIFTAEHVGESRSDGNTSVSMEELTKRTAGKIIFKGELEKRLQNRRSLDDDGLPASPLQTPPSTHGLLSQPEFTSMNGSHNSTGMDSESDVSGSLVSINSSEDEFFNTRWKSGTQNIRGVPSSDSESDVDTQFDLDLVCKTEKLSNQAAKDRARIRPRKNTKKPARRTIAATNIMPSVIEKNVLEIAHTFLDDGNTKPKPALRKIETKPLEGTNTEKRMSDPAVLQDSPRIEKSPKPVARSHTTVSVTRRPQTPPQTNKKSASLGRSIDSNELFSAFNKIKSGSSNPEQVDQSNQSLTTELNNTTTKSSNPTTDTNDKSNIDRPPSPTQPPPEIEIQEEAAAANSNVTNRSVVFQSSPPNVRNKRQPPVAAPRPKSMVYNAQTNTATTNDPDTINTSENQLSKSFNGATNNSNISTCNTHKPEEKTNSQPPSQPPVTMREKSTSLQPDWIKLAQRKTVAVASEIDSSAETNNTTNTNSQPGVPPRPASRTNPVKPGGTTPTIPSKPAANAPIIPSKPIKPTSHKSDQKLEEKPVILRKTSQTGTEQLKANDEEGKKESPELIVPRSKTTSVNSNTSNDTNTSNPACTGEDDSKPVPPWKTNLRSRPASMKVPSSKSNPAPSAAPRPNWKSSTLDSPNREHVFSKSTNETTEQSQTMFKSADNLFSKPEVVTKDRPVSMMPTSTVTEEKSEEKSREPPKSVRDMLRKFQS